MYPLVNDHIAIAGISPFLIGNTSTQSGSIFQPAMLVYRSVIIWGARIEGNNILSDLKAWI